MRSGSRASTATASVSSVGSSVVSPKDPAVAEVLRLRSEQLGPVWPESEVLLEQVVTAFLQVILTPEHAVSNEGEFGALGPRAGCFLDPGSGLGLVGTVSSRR